MHRFKIYDKIIVKDWGAQFTTPKDSDIVALTKFEKGRCPPSVKGERSRKSTQCRGEIVKLIDGCHLHSDRYGVRLPDYHKHIVMGESGLMLDDGRQDSHGFNNSSELHGTFIKIKDATDWNRAVQFYKDRGYTRQTGPVEVKYGPSSKYIYVHEKSDYITYGMSRNGITYYPASRDITHVIVKPDDPFTPQFMAEYPCEFLSSIPIPMTNTLEQLKFDKFIAKNKEAIVDLSDGIDDRLEIINNIGAVCGDFYTKVKSINASMSRAFEACNKSLLEETFNRLKDYDKLMNADTFNDLANALQQFNSSIQLLNKED